MFSTTIRRNLVAATTLVAATLVTPTVASAQLNFDNVTTNAAGFNSTAFTTYQGYTFENFGVLTNGSAFGTGNNAASPTKFAYAQADGSSFIYRTDIGFNFFSAYLSFRQLDLDATPATITVRGYRAGDINASFTKDVQLTNSTQRFDFYFDNIEELEFETSPLQANGRSAILAVDDVAVSVVPEPASLALVAAGFAALLLAARRRNRLV